MDYNYDVSMVSQLDKTQLWQQVCSYIDNLSENKENLQYLISTIASDAEILRYFIDKTIGVTNDNRMVEVMTMLLEQGGRQILEKDEEFRLNLMKKAQIHENQFVVIYEDWFAAEAYLNVYRLLEEITEDAMRAGQIKTN